MRKITFVLAILATSTLLPMKSSAQSPEEMQKWMDYMTPSEVHKMMAEWDGIWQEDIKMWMAPGTPEQTMKATVECKMIMGGRYQEQRHSGNMMGMPFEGYSLTGWDNARKIFTNTWMDNMSTGMVYMEGTWDAATKSMTLKGKMTDPMSGKQVDVRQVLCITSKDTQKMVQYSTLEGREFKSMEIVLTRMK